jgi:hypothetical protein
VGTGWDKKIRAGKVTLWWGSLSCHSSKLSHDRVKDVISFWRQIHFLHTVFLSPVLLTSGDCHLSNPEEIGLPEDNHVFGERFTKSLRGRKEKNIKRKD